VHDFYRRFVRTDATEEHYVRVGRYATILLFVCSSATVYLMDSAKDTFDIILQIGAGTGLLYLVRWFWWRVNAWCEIVAMTSSLAVSIALLILARSGTHFTSHAALLMTVGVTTVCWVATAYLGPATDRAVLVDFYRKVRPFGPGWARIQKEVGPLDAAATAGDSIPRALLGWVAGCAVIWSALFSVGNFLYGRTLQAWILFAVFVVGAAVLTWVMRRLWPE
jgi:Na+/proline symporter